MDFFVNKFAFYRNFLLLIHNLNKICYYMRIRTSLGSDWSINIFTVQKFNLSTKIAILKVMHKVTKYYSNLIQLC